MKVILKPGVCVRKTGLQKRGRTKRGESRGSAVTVLHHRSEAANMPVKIGAYVNGQFRKSRVLEEGEEVSFEVPEGKRAAEDVKVSYRIEEIIPE